MAASTARTGQATNTGFDDARIREKMGEIAEWLKANSEPPRPAPAPAPMLQVVASNPPPEGSLDGIIHRRLEARRERAAAEPDAGPMREVMGRFSGPIDAEQAKADRPTLSAAVAEIVERQRRIEETDHRRYNPSEIEVAFDKFAHEFEQRAASTFESLTDSVIQLGDMVRNAHQTPDYLNRRMEELARDLAELRADQGESERRMRELLDTVRQTLEHVAARLPERAAAPQAAEDNPSIRARAAAMRAKQETNQKTEDFDLSAHVAPERRQLIAAARRAQEPRQRPTPAYPIEAARPQTMKRTLLAGATAAALLIGIYAGSSRFLDGVFSSPETTTVAQTQTAPKTATPAAIPAPAPVVVQAPPAPPAISEPPPQLAAAPALPPVAAEPVFTNSIPQEPEPAAEQLPAEIGGTTLRSRALAGDASAQFEVATRYAEGRGIARDAEKAAMWMKRAADQGLAPAQYRLGSLMEKGTGVPKDPQGARRMYELAAAAGNVQAMHNLGVLDAEGGLGAPDMAVAIVWFRKAADFGVKDSQYNLGIFYARGLAVTQDLNQSYLWFALAAAQGDTDAASKRDQIGAKLGDEKIKAAKVTADTWKPKAAAVEANEVTPPPGGWDDRKQARLN